MAITVDNSIARVSSSAGATTVTTGTFNALNGQTILATVQSDAGTVAPATPTISNNGAALTWTLLTSNAPSASSTMIHLWTTVLAEDRTGLTITITMVGSDNTTPSIKPYLLDGADTADLLGATVNGTSATNNLTTSSITPETSGVGFAVGADWQELGVPTSSDLTISGFTIATKISGLSGYKTLTSGVGATANLDAFGTGAPDWRYCWSELRAAAAHSPRFVLIQQAVNRAARY